jgi:hypothetical protein
MSGDAHVRICESLGVKFPRATRLVISIAGKKQWWFYPLQLLCFPTSPGLSRHVLHQFLRYPAFSRWLAQAQTLPGLTAVRVLSHKRGVSISELEGTA